MKGKTDGIVGLETPKTLVGAALAERSSKRANPATGYKSPNSGGQQQFSGSQPRPVNSILGNLPGPVLNEKRPGEKGQGRSIPKIFQALPEALLAEFIFPERAAQNQRSQRNQQRSSTKVSSSQAMHNTAGSNKSGKRNQNLNSSTHGTTFGRNNNQNDSQKWKDLGEEHIVRAASVYTNIPLNKTKQLNAVLRKAHDKTLVQLSARQKEVLNSCKDGNSVYHMPGTHHAMTKKEMKKQRVQATLHQAPKNHMLQQDQQKWPQSFKTKDRPITPQSNSTQAKEIIRQALTPELNEVEFTNQNIETTILETQEEAFNKSTTGFDSKLSKSNLYKSSKASAHASRQSNKSNIYLPPDLVFSGAQKEGGIQQDSSVMLLGNRRSVDKPASKDGQMISSANTNDYGEIQMKPVAVSQLAMADGKEAIDTVGDARAQLNQSGEYTAVYPTNRVQLFGQLGVKTEKQQSCPGSGVVSPEQVVDSKQRKGAASLGAQRDQSYQLPEQLLVHHQQIESAGNLNFGSPSSINFNSKASKLNTKKQSRSKNTNRVKYQGNNVKKGMKKRIDELGSVYEQRSVMVPAAQGGSVVRTSTQDLRSMNGLSGNVSNPGSSKASRQKEVRRIEELAKQRMISQSPKLAYECANMKANSLVAGKTPSDYIKLQNTHEKRYSQNRGEAALMTREDEEVMIRNRKNLSLSCRSDKSSLPEIGNRSMNDRSMLEASGAGKDDSKPGSRQFYPSQLIEQLAMSQGAVSSSLKNCNKVHGRQENTEPGLGDLNASDDNLVSLNSSAFVDQRVVQQPDGTIGAANDKDSQNQTAQAKQFNLPQISKQSTIAAASSAPSARKHPNATDELKQSVKMKAANQSVVVDSAQLKSTGGVKPAKGGKNFGQRTQSIGRANSTSLHELGKQQSQLNAQFGQTNAPGMKRESTRQQILQPMRIMEAPASKETLAPQERTQSLENLSRKDHDSASKNITSAQRRQAGPTSNGLKPLNHTPMLKRGQAKNLITVQKAANADTIGQISAKTAAENRKTTHILTKPRQSILQEHTPDHTRAGSIDLIGNANGQREPATPNDLNDEDDNKSKVLTSAAKDMKNLMRSPLRGSSIERNIQNSATVQRLTHKEHQFTSILAQSLNAEPFYRRAIRKLGWKEVSQNEAVFKSGFHIRLTISDLEGSSKDLQARHFYNHFPQNRELVTKMGLCKNLWFNCFSEQEHKISHIFPRCYDLSVPQQAGTFIQDFNQTAILSILKIMARCFLERNNDMGQLLTHYARIKDFKEPSRFFKPHFKKLCFQKDMRSSARGNLLGISEVYDAYSFCKNFCNNLLIQENKKRGKINRASQIRMNDQRIQQMVNFQAQLVDHGVPHAGFSNYEQFKIVRLHQRLEQLLPQYRQIDGTHNIWIVKPSYNARGVGIYCTRALKDVLTSSDKTQQKVVQKYIERPFCLEGQKKFDFRQWVLVNSWEPLDVCVFETAYLKVCGSAFDLKHVGDVYRHLSNYSLQKDNGEKTEELVMSSVQFEEFMKSKIGPDFTWAKDMLPKINDVVWRTLKSVQEPFEPKTNCFEVYGFDIVLDADLEPWVIEVNLSPACNERTKWLSQMLNDSCIDLLRHIQSRILMANPVESWSEEMLALREKAGAAPHKTTKSLNPKAFYEEYEIKDRWVRLPESIQEIKEYILHQTMAPQKGVQLEAVGDKADLRFERKMDRQYRVDQSAIEIQRLYRGYCGRKIFRAALESKCAIIIQKHVRKLLAKCELHRLRQQKAATIVQKQLRRLLACKLAKKLDEERILAIKTNLVTKIQAWYRRAKAAAYVQQVRQDKASRRCQRYLRGFLARQKARRERTYLCLVVRIQRFYKRRHKARHICAALVQKQMKRRLVQKKVNRLQKIVKASSQLLSLLIKKWRKAALRKLRSHAAAIRLQSFFRMVKMRRRYKNMLKLDAQKRLRKICRRHVLKRLNLVARTIKIIRDMHATTVQKRLRNYLAKKRVMEMRKRAMMHSNATIIQRHMKGFLGKKEAKRRRIKIGAAIMIQSLIRGFITRRRQLNERLKKAKAQLQEQARKSKNVSRLAEQQNNTSQQQLKTMHRNTGVKNHQSNRVRGATNDPRAGIQNSDDKATRYQSNPPKFAKKAPRGLVPSGGARKIMKTNASQSSLIEASHHSLHNNNSEEKLVQATSSNQLQQQKDSKFTSNQSGLKKRKAVKKPNKEKSGKGSAMNEYNYEQGLKHLAQQTQGLVEKLSKVTRASTQQHNEAILAKASAKERRYALQNVRVQENITQRLGHKIYQNLQNQKIGGLAESSNSSLWHQPIHNAVKTNMGLQGQTRTTNLPGVKTTYGGDGFSANSFDDIPKPGSANAEDKLLATQHFEPLPQVDLAYDVGKQKSNQITIETRRSKEFVNQTTGQNVPCTMTPIVKSTGKFNGSDRNSNHQNSQTKLNSTKRSGVWNLPAMPQLRQSIESSTMVADNDKRVVARGLGKDENVTALQTTREISRSGRGQVTTIIMRKDPSRSSLNSGRDSKVSKGHGYAGTVDVNMSNLTADMQSSEVGKRGKVKSKQFKNLEKLVQHGAPYMQSTKPFIVNRGVGQATALREKIAEQQRQLTQAGLQALKNVANNRQPSHTTKSFAKYLGEMLKSQARTGEQVKEDSNALDKQKAQNHGKSAQNYDSVTRSNASGAFSSNGKGSLSGVRIHQPEFKPILNKQGPGVFTADNAIESSRNGDDDIIKGGSIVATTSINASGLPDVMLKTTSSQQSKTSRNEVDKSLKSSKVETKKTFVSRGDEHLAGILKVDSNDETQESDIIATSEKVNREQAKLSREKRMHAQPEISQSKADSIQIFGHRRPSKKSYSQAQHAFNKTKQGYLDQIKKDQERRYQAVTDAHKLSSMLLASSGTGTNASSKGPSRPETREKQKQQPIEVQHQDLLVASEVPTEHALASRPTDQRRGSRSFHTKRGSKVLKEQNMVLL